MRDNFMCPACRNSEDIQSSIEERHVKESYGDVIYYELEIFKCPKCDTEGDADESNNEKRRKAHQKSDYTVVKNIVEYFNGIGISTINLEMSFGMFGLIQKALSNYEKDKKPIEKSLVVLLQLTRMYPFLLMADDIAQHLRLGYKDEDEFIKKVFK